MSEIHELVLSGAEVEINGFNLKFNCATMRDHSWAREKFGETFDSLFLKSAKDFDIKVIVSIAWRLLTLESQRQFKSIKKIYMDEDGIEQTEVVGGVNLFLLSISGEKDLTALIEAVMISLDKDKAYQVKNEILKKKAEMKAKIEAAEIGK